MRCFFCGKEMEQGEDYCQGCGAELKLGSGNDIIVAPVDLAGDIYGKDSAETPIVKTEPVSSASVNDPGVLYGKMPETGSDNAKYLQGWSWGGFVFSWLWAFCNGLSFWGILTLLLSPLCLSVIPALVLGAKGRELAWKTGRTVSLEKFRDIQKKWDAAALIFLFFIIGIVLIAVLAEVLGANRG
ncbi:MAG: hypothetical protein LWY06_06635 [Firmicutes bacterium]|nr:hypothetical protein [Bacillota bacterium]